MHAQVVTSQLLSSWTAPSAARVPASSPYCAQLGPLSPLCDSSTSHSSDPIYEGPIFPDINRSGSPPPVKNRGVCTGYHALPCSTPEGERIRKYTHLPENDRFLCEEMNAPPAA